MYETRGEIVLKSLYLVYTDLHANQDGKLMPPDFRTKKRYKDVKDNPEQLSLYLRELSRNVVDYIAGMMDTYAIEEYEKYFDKRFSEINIRDLEELNKKLEID